MGTGLALGVDQNFVFEEYPSFSIVSSHPKGSSQAAIRFLIDQAQRHHYWTFDVRRSICSLFRPGGVSCETWIIKSNP